MLLIPCVHCGPRDETEFHYGGQAHVPYPEDPEAISDAEWAQFLFYRDNPKGLFAERWMHRSGCRQWFNILRDTVTYEILASYPAGAQPPHLPTEETAATGTASTAPDSTTVGTRAPSLSDMPDALTRSTSQETYK